MSGQFSRLQMYFFGPRGLVFTPRVFASFVAGVIGIVATPTYAQTEIRWSDFNATHQVCQTACTDYEWMQVLNCNQDTCWWDLELVCVSYGTSCAIERKPLPDGDIIDYSIEHGVADPAVVEFKLISSRDSWWRQVKLGGGPDPWAVWTDANKSYCNWPPPVTSNCDTNSEWAGIILDGKHDFVFGKAKFLGIHTDVYVLRDLPSQLRGGDRVTFTWR